MWAVNFFIILAIGCAQGQITIYITGDVDIEMCKTESSPGSLTDDRDGNISSDSADSVGSICSSVSGGRMVGEQCLVFNAESEDHISRSSARDACRRKGQALAHVEDLQGLKDFLNSNYNGGELFWTSGRYDVREGSWVWLDGSPVGNVPWQGSNPDGQGCLLANKDGYFDEPCTYNYYYICAVDTTKPIRPTLEDSTPDPLVSRICSSVSGGRMIGGQCLVFNRDYITWSAARDACAVKGQVLAHVEDHQRVKDWIYSNYIGYYDFWTGGSDAAKEGSWVWLDGSSVGKIPWISGAGHNGTSHNCLKASWKGYYDEPCTESGYYLCAVDTAQLEAA